jgi:transposase
MEPKKPGRPKKLNPETLQRIREVIAARRAMDRAAAKWKDADAPIMFADFGNPPTNVELAA